MGLNFSMFLQSVSQLPDNIKDDIIENCNFKMFYKSSNLETLNLIEKLGGVEAISKISIKDGVHNFTQDYENFLNITKIRALPRTSVGVVVAEYLPFPQIIQTNFVATKKEFDWSVYAEQAINYKDIKADEHLVDDKIATKVKLEKYRVYLKSSDKLLENSDLMGITLGSELIK